MAYKHNTRPTVRIQLVSSHSASPQVSVSPLEQSWWGLSTLKIPCDVFKKKGWKQAPLGHLLVIKPCHLFEINWGCLFGFCVVSPSTSFGYLNVTEPVKRGSLLELLLLEKRPVRACHQFLLTLNILASSCHFKYCGENKAVICLL